MVIISISVVTRVVNSRHMTKLFEKCSYPHLLHVSRKVRERTQPPKLKTRVNWMSRVQYLSKVTLAGCPSLTFSIPITFAPEPVRACLLTAEMLDLDDSYERVLLLFGLRADDKELETLRALRASLESIKQIVQGVHDDLLVSQHNYTELVGHSTCLEHAYFRITTEMDRDGRPD